jgi:peptidoglycan/xylan/chitin deacetylase (PgdA/CDA1 family)
MTIFGGLAPRGTARSRFGSLAAVESIAPAGQQLDSEVRAALEPRFGRDLSGVRIHADQETALAVEQLNAGAIASGHGIAFAPGRYDPRSRRGLRRLAHELAHVIQYQQVGPAPRPRSEPGDHAEQEARSAAAALEWGTLREAYPTLTADVESGPGRFVPPKPVLRAAPAAVSLVELTYDDGPDPAPARNTRHVLDALKAAGARATFYLVGKKVAQGDNWRLVFDMAASGQWLGNHAFDWGDAKDDHIFLHGTAEQRAEKILLTEWAIRDALIRGRDAAKSAKTWDSIPAASQAYIEDVIAHGTGRFRTPGFGSHAWKADGATTGAAIASANRVLAAAGLRPFAVTDTGIIPYEGVDVDPHDYKSGRTKEGIFSQVALHTSANDKSILLHSRVAATAEVTPKILEHLNRRGYSFDPTPQGALGSLRPEPGFAGLGTISNPPSHAQIAAARSFLSSRLDAMGPFFAGSIAIGIFQLAQQAGSQEVDDFIAWVRTTSVKTPDGVVPLANWMAANPEWREFLGFYENWRLSKPFPKVPGVTQ